MEYRYNYVRLAVLPFCCRFRSLCPCPALPVLHFLSFYLFTFHWNFPFLHSASVCLLHPQSSHLRLTLTSNGDTLKINCQLICQRFCSMARSATHCKIQHRLLLLCRYSHSLPKRWKHVLYVSAIADGYAHHIIMFRDSCFIICFYCRHCHFSEANNRLLEDYCMFENIPLLLPFYPFQSHRWTSLKRQPCCITHSKPYSSIITGLFVFIQFLPGWQTIKVARARVWGKANDIYQ